MTITAKVIADSVSGDGVRLTTLELRYPRFIHAEFMTHRLFSRNASSSRAIPIEKMIADVIADPAMPVWWGKNQSGMQAREELSDILTDAHGTSERSEAEYEWREAMQSAVSHAKYLHRRGLHKQIVNRVLEPFAHITVIVTATEWSNFFHLRMHADAQPEIRALAVAMADVRSESVSKLLEPGQWHLPYVTDDDRVELSDRAGDNYHLAMISAARCARVSYLTHDGKVPNMEKDMKLANQLSTSGHWSPFEHQATPDGLIGTNKADARLCRNFTGWRQHRAMIGG